MDQHTDCQQICDNTCLTQLVASGGSSQFVGVWQKYCAKPPVGIQNTPDHLNSARDEEDTNNMLQVDFIIVSHDDTRQIWAYLEKK